MAVLSKWVRPGRGSALRTLVVLLGGAAAAAAAPPLSAAPVQLAASDTLRTLTPQTCYELLLAHHPVVRQAGLLTETARAELQLARGAFDPKLESGLARKEFKGSEYYTTWDSHLKAPLWPGGLDLKAGYERHTGQYLNPQNRVPAGGLTYAGVGTSLAAVLGVDERRATLRQAQLYQEIAEAERQKLVNKVVSTALKAYWDWFEAARRRELLRGATQLAAERYQATAGRVLVGDLAAIDTLEAGLLLRERRVAQQQAELDTYQAALALSTHLWGEQAQPLTLDPRAPVPTTLALPPMLTNAELSGRLMFVVERHPEVQKLLRKTQQLRLEERLRRNELLPNLDVNYNFLNQGVGLEGAAAPWLTNSYKLGAQLSVPLLLRKERGKLQSVRIKQVYNDLDLLQVRRELTAVLQQSAAEQQTLERLLVQQRRMTEAYRQLRQGEVEKFEAGESTVFLVNTRDSKLIEAELKQVQLEAKLQKARIEVVAAGGALDWQP